MLVRLNHPYRFANTGDLLDLPDSDARSLIRQAAARPVTDLVTHAGGGWYEVELHNPKRFVKVHGQTRAIDRLRRNE